MYGLNGALPISLQINSPTQLVGQQPTYRIANAIPGTDVVWDSFKNGVATGEGPAAYGHVIGANGSLEVAGGNWRDEDIGRWIKKIEIRNPDGTLSEAIVGFDVIPAQSTQVPIVNTGADFFHTSLFDIGGFEVTPTTLLLALGGIWAAKQLRLIK